MRRAPCHDTRRSVRWALGGWVGGAAVKFRWIRLALASLAVVAAGILATGGSAGPRLADVTFDAFPGPGQVTYGEQIAYKATFKNTSGTTLTHVIFRQSYPKANGVESTPVPGKNTCPVAPVTITKADGSHVWTCDFGNLSANAAPVALTVVWQVPPQGSATASCIASTPTDCLTSNGRWTVKEGVNDVSDPNDAFPSAAGIDRSASLLLSGSSGVEALRAGGYETQGSSCANGGSGNLRTNPDVGLGNPVSTMVCLPTFTIPSTNLVDLGYVTEITELLGDAHHSELCVSVLGTDCSVGYTPATFPLPGITLVFRVADAALPKGYKITGISHNGGLPVTQGLCDSSGFCVVSIDLVNVQGTKTWVMVVTTPTNGSYTW